MYSGQIDTIRYLLDGLNQNLCGFSIHNNLFLTMENELKHHTKRCIDFDVNSFFGNIAVFQEKLNRIVLI